MFHQESLGAHCLGHLFVVFVTPSLSQFLFLCTRFFRKKCLFHHYSCHSSFELPVLTNRDGIPNLFVSQISPRRHKRPISIRSTIFCHLAARHSHPAYTTLRRFHVRLVFQIPTRIVSGHRPYSFVVVLSEWQSIGVNGEHPRVGHASHVT
jgi:hypothetical protein